MTDVVFSIDQGTQSTRVYAFDTNFAPIAHHQIAFPQIYPQAGYVMNRNGMAGEVCCVGRTRGGVVACCQHGPNQRPCDVLRLPQPSLNASRQALAPWGRCRGLSCA